MTLIEQLDKIEPPPLDILYQDEHLVAINKPSGLLVHRSPIDKNETEFVVQRIHAQLDQYVYPIHRLDKPTSGILLLALSPQMAKLMCQNWSNAHKCYHAICRGMAPSEQFIDHPITTKPDMGDRFTTPKVQTAQTAITRLHYATVLTGFGAQALTYPTTTFSLIEACIHTGRKHQIRKHLKHINHPIVGDTQYGKGDINRYFREHYAVNRLLLHCHRIEITHPLSLQRLSIRAPHDDTWRDILQAFWC